MGPYSAPNTGPHFSISTPGKAYDGNCTKETWTASQKSWEVSSELPEMQWENTGFISQEDLGPVSCYPGSPWDHTFLNLPLLTSKHEVNKLTSEGPCAMAHTPRSCAQGTQAESMAFPCSPGHAGHRHPCDGDVRPSSLPPSGDTPQALSSTRPLFLKDTLIFLGRVIPSPTPGWGGAKRIRVLVMPSERGIKLAWRQGYLSLLKLCAT